MILRKSRHINEDMKLQLIHEQLRLRIFKVLNCPSKSLTDFVLNALIKYYKMTADQYKVILSKVKLIHPEM